MRNVKCNLFVRVVAQERYLMIICLVGHQMPFLEEESLEQAYRLAPYIALHDSPAFLTCALAPGAAYRDLLYIQGIRELRSSDQAIADRVLHSLKGQSWYLDEPWLATALVGPDVPRQEKEAIARALAGTPRPLQYPPFCVTPSLKHQLCHQEAFWPEDSSLPSLAPMVGPRSWQLLELLKLEGEDVSWLTLPQSSWESHPGFIKFSAFLAGLTVTNDAGEKTVKLIQVCFFLHRTF